jgi:hypothetical protein
MSWTKRFDAWGRRSDSPAAADAEKEIDDELMFHLRSLVDDSLAKGLPLDAAWQRAQDRFGSLRHYSAACRSIPLKDHIMLQKFSALAVVVLTLLVGWLLLEVRSLEQHIALLDVKPREAVLIAQTPTKAAVKEAPNDAMLSGRNDIAGRVLDRHDGPLAGASVLVILKTWPGGRYQQEAFAAVTDAKGGFRLPRLIPLEGQYAVQMAAIKDGYTLTSIYRLVEEGSHPTLEPVTLHCDVASRITLIVHDSAGRPVANARVFPAARQSSTGETHLVYFQASKPIQTASDAEGRVGLGCFERGDQAEIYVQLPGQDWQRHAIAIPSDGDILVLSAAESGNPTGGNPPNPPKKS